MALSDRFIKVFENIRIVGRDTGNPAAVIADSENIDMDFENTLAAVGTAKAVRLRMNNKVDATGDFRSLDMEVRTNEDCDVGTMTGILINTIGKGDCTIGEFRPIEIKHEWAASDVVTTAHGIAIEYQLKSAPTNAAGILLKSTDTHPPKYGVDMQGNAPSYPLNPASAAIRFNNDICILTGTGEPDAATGAGIAGPGSLYLRALASTASSQLYTNDGTKATPAWAPVVVA